MRYVPGVQAIQVGQAGGTTSLFIRGGGYDANKVLLDGIPANDIGGGVEFANVSSAALAQVEVLRGPNSALYGADALAGVVSLTTLRGGTPLPLLTYLAEGGNFGTYHQEGSIGGQHKQIDYFSDYSRFDSGNALPDDEYHNGTFAGNFGWMLSPASSLRATIHHDQVASGVPGAIRLYGIPNDAKQANEDAYFGVTWEDRTNAKWNNLVRYGGVRLRSQYTEFAPAGTPQSSYSLGAPATISGANGYSVTGQALEPNDGPPYPYIYPGSTDKDFVYAQSDYRFNPHILGLVAFRYEDERGYAGTPQANLACTPLPNYPCSPLPNSVQRGNYSYTFHLQGDIHNRLFYTLGGGFEDNGLFGYAGTPRASLAWQVAGNTKLRASFGKGIKEPAVFDQLESLNALLVEYGYGGLVSQDRIAPIGPENSRTFDGGIDRFILNGRGRMSLSLFHNEFTNGIEYVSPFGLTLLGLPSAIVMDVGNNSYGATVNSKAYRAQGIEAEFETQLTRDWFARGGYTYTDARIQHSFTGDAIGASSNPNFPNVPIGAFSPLIGARPFPHRAAHGLFPDGLSPCEALCHYQRNAGLSQRRQRLLYDANYGPTLLLPNRNLDAAYQRLDLNTSYQATRMVSVEGNFQNLLCEHFSEAFGYPSLPFTFRMGMKFTLGGESWPGK